MGTRNTGIFVVNGKLTFLSEMLLLSVTLFGFFAAPQLDIPSWLLMVLLLFSVVSALILMFEGRSSAIGLKPFSKDPTDWRAAKKTYINSDSDQVNQDRAP